MPFGIKNGVYMYYSASINGFFTGSGSSLPPDAVAITSAEHLRLMSGQMSGQMIAAGDDGYPVLRERPPLSREQFMAIERTWRDGVLASTDALVSRHRDEGEEGVKTTLLPEQYAELQSFRRDLRNWPDSGEFPLSEHRPLMPLWLAEQIQ